MIRTTVQLLQVRREHYILILRLALSLICIGSAAAEVETFAQKKRESVKGVANFGRVTDTYFRGGEVTAEGLKNLAGMGVRTVIDLREEADEEEAQVCKELGMAYHSFPMTTEDTPDPAKIEQIVQIIEAARAPVYVHCSGGKHRTGTVCAYFRITRQKQSAERAWREQQMYGFGTPEEHTNLFTFIYGNTPIASKLKPLSTETPQKVATPAEEKADTKTQVASPAPASNGNGKEESLKHPQGHLAATAHYLSLGKAFELTRSHGAKGEVIRVNLEYDKKNAAPVWKVLHATGTEYRLHAITGDLLGTKSKAEKLGFLNPLGYSSRYWTFQKVIAKAESRAGEKVIEMELKSVKGRNQTFFEVMMADGVTLFFDAAKGHQIHAF